MTGLPEQYASPLHLPFNRSSLAGRLIFEAPDQDPGGPGFCVALQGNRLMVVEGQEGLALPEETAVSTAPADTLYLGRWANRPCRLLEIPRKRDLTDRLLACSVVEERPRLPIDLLSLGGLGRMILHWEGNSRFCSGCGDALRRLPGEWGKTCPGCGAHHFPHIHPCAIVLVRRPGELLLTRKPTWAAGRYSLVAGFLEFGECLEEAAAREVAEETGVAVSNILYLGSQCWPFPSQLMCGFVADYVSGEVQVERRELEDARWFPVEDLPILPPKRSIARYLLDTTLGLPAAGASSSD